MSFVEHRFRSHDGLSLYYRDYPGEATPVICLPGLTRNSRDFEDLAEHLSPGHRVLTPDFRGRGHSDRDPKIGNYHPGTYTGDVFGLLDQLEIQQVFVVGTSLGGLVAMIMASQQPERLKGIVLNDIGPEISPGGHQRILGYVGLQPPVNDWEQAAQAVKAAYEVALPVQPDSFWLKHARRSYREDEQGVPVLDSDPGIGEALRKARGPLRVLKFLRRWGVMRKLGGVFIDPWDSFRSVSMPCLVLRGERSDILSAETVEKMRVAKPDLEAVTVPERGHTPLLDEPVSLAAIDGFLGRAG
jgi:pimeloyl-ACP methyl ester carboxylesterase